MGHVSMLQSLAILFTAIEVSHAARIRRAGISKFVKAEKSKAGPALDLEGIIAAFNSREGLTLRVAELSERGLSKPASASVWRHDLPRAVHGGPAKWGIIFKPDSTKALCAYPGNAGTNSRVRIDNNGTLSARQRWHKLALLAGTIEPPEELKDRPEDPCGVVVDVPADVSGQCNFTTPKEFANFYFNREDFTSLGWALCHYTEVPEMLEAQKEFLKQAVNLPPNVKWDVSQIAMSMTLFNEVIIDVHDADSVGGIFFAHSGPFMEKSEIAELKTWFDLSSLDNTLPVFEFAGVETTKDWLESDQSGIGGNASLMFRQFDESLFA